MAFQAAVLDVDCPMQTIHEVRLHHNAVTDLFSGLTLKHLLELDWQERESFFEVYSGLAFEGRSYFYFDKFKRGRSSITIREAKLKGTFTGNGGTGCQFTTETTTTTTTTSTPGIISDPLGAPSMNGNEISAQTLDLTNVN